MDITTHSDDWKNLYYALLRDLQLDPMAFQLVYPYTSWNWPTSAPDYTSAPQHDFCATMPQWSLAGAYFSSGIRFDDAYGMFLSVLKAHSVDPKLQRAIDQQQRKVEKARRQYDFVHQKAAAVYEKTTKGLNDPVFTIWLTTPTGKAWKRRLDSAWTKYEQQYEALDKLISQSETPGLREALANFADHSYYSRYQDSALSGFPAVPGYSVAKTPSEWVDEVLHGEGVPGTAHLTAQTTQVSETWTNRFLPVDYPFFGVYAQGEERLVDFDLASSDEMEITIHFEAWDTIPISPEPWYNGGFVCARREGPFMRGYSGEPHGEDTYLWGQGGAMSIYKTALLVAYNASFRISPAPQFQAQVEKLAGRGDDRLRIGPFLGHREEGATRKLAKLQEGDAAHVPMIFGINVELLPC